MVCIIKLFFRNLLCTVISWSVGGAGGPGGAGGAGGGPGGGREIRECSTQTSSNRVKPGLSFQL